MVVNVDVSNAVFWNEQSLLNAARELTGTSSPADLANKSQPVRANVNAQPSDSAAMVAMRKLKKNEFTVRHKGRTQKECKFQFFAFLSFLLHHLLTHISGEDMEDRCHCLFDCTN